MKRKISLIAMAFAACGVALAQQAVKDTSPKTAPAKTAQAGDIRIRNSASGTALYDNKRGISRISKDVVVTQDGEDFILYCDEIVYNERSNEAVARGNLRLQSRDSTMTGVLMRADFDAKVITVLTNVVMNSHGKGDGARAQNDFKHKPSQINCDRVDYNYENRQATMTGNIRMAQEENSGTCSRILFDEERNVAHLQGDVVFRNGSNKRTIKASDVTVWIDDDMVQTNNRTTVVTPRGTPARPVGPRDNVAPVPTLPDEFLREFGRTLPPPPTPAPPKDDDDEAPAAAPAPAPKKPETDNS